MECPGGDTGVSGDTGGNDMTVPKIESADLTLAEVYKDFYTVPEITEIYRYFVDSGLFTMSDLCGHFLSIWQ